MECRRTRWPTTANPYLLVNRITATQLGMVTRDYVHEMVRHLPVTIDTLRRDGLLANALAAKGDPLVLARLFGLSYNTAVAYCAQLGLLDDLRMENAE
jgi:hypothetical protein